MPPVHSLMASGNNAVQDQHPTAARWRGALLFAAYAGFWIAVDLVCLAAPESALVRNTATWLLYAGTVAGPATLMVWALRSRAPARVRWPALLAGGAMVGMLKVAALCVQLDQFVIESLVLATGIVICQFAAPAAVIACCWLYHRAALRRAESPPGELAAEAAKEEEAGSMKGAQAWRFNIKDLLLWTLLTAMAALTARLLFSAKQPSGAAVEWFLILSPLALTAVAAATSTPLIWAALARDIRGCSCTLALAGFPLLLALTVWSPVPLIEALIMYLTLLPLRFMDIRLLPPPRAQPSAVLLPAGEKAGG